MLLQGRIAMQAHRAANMAADHDGVSISAYLEQLVLADSSRRDAASGPRALRPRATPLETRLIQGRVSEAAHAAALRASKNDGVPLRAYLERLCLEDAEFRALEPNIPTTFQERMAI